MIEFFVKKPVTTIMLVMFFVVMGLFSIPNILIEKTPEIAFPMVTVKVEYPGATPEEVESQVVNKIEDAVAEVSDIKKVRSFSYENFAFVFVQFYIETDANVKLIEVKDKVEAIYNDLPEGIDKPMVEKYDPLIAPVLYAILTSDKHDLTQLYEFADKEFKDRFTSVNGVAKAEILGGKERQINILLDPNLMKEKYVTITNVIDTLAQFNTNVPGGAIDKKENLISLRFVGEFLNVEKISQMLVASKDGGSFMLKEIAKIEDGHKDVDSIMRFEGKEAVGLSVMKASGANVVSISKKINSKLGELRAALPEGMKLDIVADSTVFIVDENNRTLMGILQGMILTFFILYFFTGHINLTFIASIVIPASLISTLFAMDASGFSFNFCTLLAIATSLGTLIANAIVIIENVVVHVGKGKTAEQAAIDGTKEVTGAVIAATATNLVVFTPIATMGDIIGQFMRSFGLTVVYATLFSLFASFSLTPMLCAKLLHAGDNEVKHKKTFNPFVLLVEFLDDLVKWLVKEYHIVYDFMIKHRRLVLLSSMFIFMVTKPIMPYLASDFVPSYDEDKFMIDIKMPQGTTIEKVNEVVADFEKQVAQIPEMKTFFSLLGDQGEENAVITVELKTKDQRQRTDMQIMESLYEELAKIPDAEIVLRREGMGSGTGDVSINVGGADYEKVIIASKKMAEIMNESGYFSRVTNSFRIPKNEIRFLPDQKKVMESGLNNAYLGKTIRAGVYGNDKNIYKEKGEDYKINIRISDDYKQSFDFLKNLDVMTKNGVRPVSDFGDIVVDKSFPLIRHRDRKRVIRLEGYLAKSNPGSAMKMLSEKFLAEPELKDITFKFVESAEMQGDSQREIGKAFLTACILTFMVLAAILNSFWYTIPIVMCIFTSFIGVFYALFFAEQSINVLSMLGFIMLVGLVVNNAILVMDCAIQKMDRGVDVVTATREAMGDKMKAVLMTSIAIIFGTLPQCFSVDPAKSSMGYVMIGGMLASILFTFVYVPVHFYYCYTIPLKAKKLMHKLFKR